MRKTLELLGRTLGLAAALTIACAGTVPLAGAQPTAAASERGDLALVPYYTVRHRWVTGLHIVNTSKRTQVVKVRFRRATDAMDALDFNLVLSPHDVYAGFLSRDPDGAIAWASPDTSCTVPATRGNRLHMPDLYRAGAESGYVEIIAMGAPEDEGQPIALAAASASTSSATGATVTSTGTSAASVPRDCVAVRSNFFADGAGTVDVNSTDTTTRTTKPGVEDHATTWQRGNAASLNAVLKAGGRNTYVDSGDVLKVSYFIRDNATGIEFGDNAVHLSGFLGAPAITNQQYSVLSGDLNGFDFPDLNGGVPLSSGAAGSGSIQRGRFDALRVPNALGVSAIANEWSANPANGVEMDWVVTLPGQYVMLRLPQYAASLSGTGRPWAATVDSASSTLRNPQCPRRSTPAAARAKDAAGDPLDSCDYRDMPVELAVTAYNREEGSSAGAAEPRLVVSPTAPSTRPKTYLPKAVNVITFGGNSVFGGRDADVSARNMGQPYGWVSAEVTSRDTDLRVCDWDFNDDIGAGFGAAAGAALKDKLVCSEVTPGSAVPVIGFAAWSRKVAANPDASYGRIVEHSSLVVPGTVFRDVLKDGGQGPQMVVLPTGRFRMGDLNGSGDYDERVVRTVTISRRIAMGRYEVTFADYDRFVAATGTRRPSDRDWGRDTRPVINVNWNEAKAYAAWLSKQTGKRYRLPTEAEWEYAARAGTTKRYAFGNSIDCSQARYGRRSSSSECIPRGISRDLRRTLQRTAPVGSFMPSAFGLYDMHGNVSEWVEDCYVDTYNGAPTDGSARTTGCGASDRPVVRGGHWRNSASRFLRSANRAWGLPSARARELGFRLVQDLNP